MRYINKMVVTLLFILGTTSTHAGVIIDELSISSTELSFTATGNIDVLGPHFPNQIIFGVLSPSLDWINTFDLTTTTWTFGATHTGPSTINDMYMFDSTLGRGIATDGPTDYSLGQIMDIEFSVMGSFNPANFNTSAFGLQVGGINDTAFPYIQARYNLVDEINLASVPEPNAIALMGLGLLGFDATRPRLQK